MQNQEKKFLKVTPAETTFATVLIIVILLILPQLGAKAMAVGSGFGCAVYFALFPGRFRGRNGSLTLAFWLFGALFASSLAFFFYALVTGNWR